MRLSASFARWTRRVAPLRRAEALAADIAAILGLGLFVLAVVGAILVGIDLFYF